MKKNFSFIESFRCAFRGIVYIFKTERNFKFHVMFSLLVLLCSLIFNLSYIELSIILIMIVIVLVLEIINTIMRINENRTSAPIRLVLVTRSYDLEYSECKDYNLNIKIIKDMSSGAVLVSAFISVIVGLLIFIPKILVIVGD